MNTFKKNKGTLMAAILVLAGFYAFSMFKDTLIPMVVTADEPVGADLVELFAGLQAVTLDKELFSSPLYTSLLDFSTELSPQPTGRPNPFSPIGQD